MMWNITNCNKIKLACLRCDYKAFGRSSIVFYGSYDKRMLLAIEMANFLGWKWHYFQFSPTKICTRKHMCFRSFDLMARDVFLIYEGVDFA